jgi:hypothetical protein
MNQSFRTDNKKSNGTLAFSSKSPGVKLKTDDNINLRSDVNHLPKLRASKKDGVLDIESIKLGSVDEDEDEMLSDDPNNMGSKIATPITKL